MCETDAPNGTNGQSAPAVRLRNNLRIIECCADPLLARPRPHREATTHTRLSRTTSPMLANSRSLSQLYEVSMLLLYLPWDQLTEFYNQRASSSPMPTLQPTPRSRCTSLVPLQDHDSKLPLTHSMLSSSSRRPSLTYLCCL